MSRKILIIGIDGGTWTVLTPAMAHGYMPHLKSIIDTGSSGTLLSTLPAITPPAWGSFQTGVNPGANGVFDFSYWDKKQKKIHYVSSNSLKKTIWQIASEAGKRVGLINVPMTYPPQKINGCMVTGVLTPSIESDFTYPPQLKKQLLKAVPDYHIFNLKNARGGSPHENFKPFVQQMAAVVENRAKAAEFLLNTEPFDIFMVHFQSTDVIQHAMWPYLDKNHPLYNTKKNSFIFDTFYKFLDQKIQLICQAFEKTAGDDFITIIASDHGSEVHKKSINLGNWLCQQGFLKFNPKSTHPTLLKKITQKLRVGKLMSRFISAKTVSKVEKSLTRYIDSFLWDQSKAFSIGKGGEGFIYLLDENNSEREKTATKIIEKLKTIKDPQIESSVIKAIHHKEDIFHGDFLELMPDITIEPANGYSFRGAYQPNEDIFHTISPGLDFHLGKHHRDGIIIAAGSHIKSQISLQARLIDITPTLLYYMQLPVYRYMDGRVIQELFTDEFKTQNPLPERVDTVCLSKRQHEMTYSNQDEKKIQQRLKDLGYM